MDWCQNATNGPRPAVQPRIAVVIPTYKAKNSILGVLASIGSEVEAIYVVDDACPQRSGELVTSLCHDARVRVITLTVNQGVGGAVLTGYSAASADGCDVIVKVDSDGQMDPRILTNFVQPIIDGRADYTKGNRFFDAYSFSTMPKIRVWGNIGLSFMTKISTGYWNILDPTNGYTAIHAKLIDYLPRDLISKRFFFETDMLFYLGILRASVIDIPMVAFYGDEISNLSVFASFKQFPMAHLTRFLRRIILVYFVRDFSFASLYILAGVPLTVFGVFYGLWSWFESYMSNSSTAPGTIALSGISLVLGIQLLLSFLQFDASSAPKEAIHRVLGSRAIRPLRQFN